MGMKGGNNSQRPVEIQTNLTEGKTISLLTATINLGEEDEHLMQTLFGCQIFAT